MKKQKGKKKTEYQKKKKLIEDLVKSIPNIIAPTPTLVDDEHIKVTPEIYISGYPMSLKN